MTSHVVTMVTKCLNSLVFVQASICENFLRTFIICIVGSFCWFVRYSLRYNDVIIVTSKYAFKIDGNID